MTQVTSNDVISTYRRYAPLYDLVFGAVLGPGRRHMADAVTALKPDHLLEIGVGTGLALRNYPSKSTIVGIDLSPEMLEKARLQASRLPRHAITLHTMDAENLEFPDNSFDCVTVPYVLSVTPNPDRLIAELRRVCKPQGKIIIVNHFSGSRFWWLMERTVSSLAGKIGFRSEFSYQQHIEAHTWTVERVRSVNLFGLSKLVDIRNDK